MDGYHNDYNIGVDPPTVPQWSGPPHTIVQVQAILLASLTASLFSAFLAMLGKQWLNRYASVDMRGSAIERSQNRQRKLDGIVTWYFDHVMESLPMMLQAALLLLGCALSRYLWEINTTVALVVLGVTSFGVLFYLFIVIAGAAFMSCPYQTPGARIIRSIPDTISLIPDTFRPIFRIPGILRSVFSAYIEKSFSYGFLRALRGGTTRSPVEIAATILLALLLPICLIMDICVAIASPLVVFSYRVYLRLQQVSDQTAVLNLHCILWTLRTSLDGPARLSTLNYLATTTLTDFDPTLVIDCFDVLFGCVNPIGAKVVITQGSEQLATAAALCCLHTLSHLVVMEPTPRALENVRQRYTRTFQSEANFHGLPFSHTLGAIHRVFYPTHVDPKEIIYREGNVVLQRELRSRSSYLERRNRWEDYGPSSNEHVIVAHALTKIARFEYQKGGYRKVPRWLLRFALHSLSQSPLPPTSVIINCLSIIAIDLCPDPLHITTSDRRYVYIWWISAFLTES